VESFCDQISRLFALSVQRRELDRSARTAQSCSYTELWNAFKRITAGASAAEKTALYSGTATRVYRLTAP
jgi:hypothetical protein